MKIAKHILIILIFLVNMLPINTDACERINFENIKKENGLSQASVETIIQDSYGYIWMGTNEGLNRYNGSEIKQFKSDEQNENSIIDNYVTSLVENDDDLWVGTTNGISKINLEDYSIKNYRYYKNKPYGGILKLYKSYDKEVYVGSKQGIFLYNEKKDDFDRLLEENDKLNNMKIFSLNKDKSNNLWIGTDEGLYKLNLSTKQSRLYKLENMDSRQWGRIYSIIFDNENNMWIGTSEEGLKRINFAKNEIKSFKIDKDNENYLKSKVVRDILQDKEGTIWVATEKGLSKYVGNDKFTTYLNNTYDSGSLSNNKVFDLMEDESGLIWAGTFSGVSRFDYRNKIEIYRNDMLSDNFVMGVYEDDEGLLWVGTSDSGLNILDRKKEKVQYITEGNTNKNINSNEITIIEGHKDTIWVGTRKGLNKINKKDMTIEKYTEKDGLSDNIIKGLLVDSKNNLWIGTPKGLSILDSKTNKIINITSKLKKLGIKETYIQEIYEDSEGIFWLGGYTSSGLIRLDIKNNTIETFQSFKSNDNQKEETVAMIRDIKEDEHFNLWIGTNNGLLYFDKIKKEFKSYTEKDGLANNTVYQVLVDGEKNLWMSTNNGISKLDIKNNRFVNLSSTDGLQSSEFNGNSAYKCKSGELAFGGIEGLNVFDPTEIKENDYNAKVNFDNFEVEGKSYKNINGYVFSYDKNFIRVKYFMTNYRKNENIQYFYKLDGLSNGWVSVKGNEIIFESLPPGKYKLSIKCRNSNGKISEENSVSFKINPPIWKSDIAKVSYILITIILIYGGVNRVKQLDILVDIRTKELNNEMEKNKILFDKMIESERSKNNYFINLSHELRTPLNVINSIEQLIRSRCKSDKELTKDKLEDYMDIMRSNTNRLLNLINNIIDTSKIENGKYRLNKSKHDIVYIVEEASLSLKESIESSGIELVIDTDVEEKIINCDRYEIERCIVNLVSNAQKFTPQGGRININIEDIDKYVKIIVEDNGIGIEKKYHDTIFDRFNQVVDEHSENKGGSGLGLTITKHIIDLHKGKIYIESEKNKGTKFKIILPVDA